MRVLLLAINFLDIPYPVYPLGAAIAARLARMNDHEVMLHDLFAHNNFQPYDSQKLQDLICQYNPDCVGLSLRNLESAEVSTSQESWSLDRVRQIVSDIKSVTSNPVFLGGSGFSLMPELILRHVGADYGLASEAEESLPDFLACLAQGREPGKLTQKTNSGCTIQLSAYEPELVKAYAAQGGLIGVQTKRGCHLQCSYCSYPWLEGRSLRIRPVPEIMADLRYLCELVKNPQIAFADAVFNDPAGQWLDLLEAMAINDLPLKWTAFFQPASLKPYELDLIKAAKAAGLEFGTDGSNDAVLAGLNKPFSFALVKEMQTKCAEFRIPAAHYVIFGGPGETHETTEEGIRNLAELKSCVVFITAGISLYPHTPLFDLARAEGVLGTTEEIHRPVYYYAPAINPAKLHARLQEVFMGQRDRLYPPSRATEQARVLRRMGYTGILWDTLIGAGRRKHA